MAMELWTAATPNGWKVNIMVEELIELGIEVSELKVRSINLQKGEQFSEEFTHLESVVWLCAFDSLLVNAYERLLKTVLLVYNADVFLFLCIHSKMTHATRT